jgi:hypothetical protein
MIKVITIAAMVAATFVAGSVPAVAQAQEVCLTKTIFGEEIAPMCFVPESISSATDGTCWRHFAAPILVCGDPAKRPVINPGGDRPEPPKPLPAPIMPIPAN